MKIRLDMTWRSTLKSACIVGNLNTVKSLVGKHDLDEECDYLFWAALYGREEIVEFLIEYGVDVNIKLTEYLYECALHTAIAKGHVNVVRILVEKGADVNVVDRYGSTPLMLAAKRGYLEMVQFLIDHGARINAMNNQGCTVLMLATEHQYWEMVSFLIEHGAGVNAVDCYGRIPLMFAAECQHWEMVSFLTKHGATVNVVDRKGHTPLMLAAERGHWKTVSFLINHGARVNVLDKNGCTPLMLAAKGGHWDIVSFLLEHGASAQGKLKDKLSRTPLHCVANSCSVNIIAKLVSLGANVNAQDDNSVTPLMKAVEKGYFDTVSFLIRHGADVKLKDNRGRTALHFIRYGKADKIIELLVTSGANIDEEDNGMQTPLQTSILTAISCSCYSSVPCIFVEHGANVTRLSPSQGGMLVCCCIHCKYFDLTHSMVTAGVSIGVKNGECVNPLVLASQNGHDSLVKALILAGVNVNLKDTIGYTALHWAARKQHIQCGVLLAQAGSDLSIRNYRGKTALELASKVFNLSIQAALSFTTKRTVCVIGNACSGKSTLIASLQNENESFLNKCKHWLFGVEEIRNRTAGIDPISFISHKYGNVVFFDFAGQHEYHGPHEMFMESLFNQRGSTVTIIVVAKATEEESVITQQLERWLHPLRKLSSSSTNPIRVIVAGSFMDQVEAQSTAQEKVENCYQSLKKSYSEVPVTFQGLCFLNCRQPYSSGFADLCQYLQEVPVLQVQANTTYSLCWVSSQMKTLIVKDKALRLSSFAKWIDDNKGNLPKNMPSADDVCKDLSSTGHYLYLPNKEEPLNSWLVLDLPAILHEVYGTLFSRSKKIVNEFGLLSVQELGNLFSSLDVGMICDVLIAMDFCIEVDPVILKEEILKLTSDTSECHDFLFFPALVSLKRPKVFENTQPDHVCHTLCWQFQANPNHFISPRLIQTIILRLSSLHVLHCADTRQHYCSVWWNGLSWPTLTGVVIAVQISNNAVIQVIGRSTTDPNDLCRYLSWITRDIKSTIAQINPSLSGCAYIIHGVDPEVLLSDPSSPFPHEMYPLSIVLESTRTGKTSCFSSKPSPGQARVKRISEVFCGTCPSEDVVELMYYGEFPSLEWFVVLHVSTPNLIPS